MSRSGVVQLQACGSHAAHESIFRAFSVARGSIQEKSTNLKFAEKFVRSICLTELLALDKVHLHKNNE